MSHYCEETYDVYREDVRKARKPHVCGACKLPIQSGDYYCSVFIVFDGEAETVKRCGACQKTHEHLRKLDPEMWPNERLACGKSYEDEWDSEPPEHIESLPFLSDAQRGQLLKPAKVSP